MKKLLFYIICLPFIISAQIPNQGYLVNSIDIGEDLLLFVPDSAVQILTNPSRAAEYKSEFIFVTKSGSSSRRSSRER